MVIKSDNTKKNRALINSFIYTNFKNMLGSLQIEKTN